MRDVFKLEEMEEIFYEFSCSLSQTASMPGRLYVTEHFLCFSSNVLGIESKVSVPCANYSPWLSLFFD